MGNNKKMIRKSILSVTFAALLLALTSSAYAANLPRVKAYEATTPKELYDWTGFYVGAQVGYSFANTKFGSNLDGVVAGVHAGYNYQINRWVLGVEGDLEASNVNAATTRPNILRFTGDLGWFGSVRGRVGYSFDRILIYATGGGAFAGMTGRLADLRVIPVLSAASRNTYYGWTVGGGIEYAITQKISARAEYRYTDLGKKTYVFAATSPAPIVNADIRGIHTVRLGISYRF